MHWTLSGRLQEDLLLKACWHNQVVYTQCEGPRGEWLWRLIESLNGTARFRGPILNALNQLSDERNAIQLCDLAKIYAEAGDETFRTRLYGIVEHKPFSTMPWLGEE